MSTAASASENPLQPASLDPLISVIIPAYRGSATILACLASLRQALVGWSHELIVVESSGDGTACLIRDHVSSVRLIVAEQRLSAGQARNVAIAEARGEWLFFVDQDCVVPANWIAALLAHLRQADVGGAGGSLAVANPENLSGWCTYFLEFLHHFPQRRKATVSHGFLLGSNSAWRSDVLKTFRFPDQTLAEDVLLSHAVRRNGWQLIYDPTITIYHHNRQGWNAFFTYCRAMGRASARAHRQIQPWWLVGLARCPILVYITSAGVLSMIAFRLTKAPLTYFLRFLLLFPVCLFGHLLWAHAFATELRGPASPE